jgi:hypothetical protein
MHQNPVQVFSVRGSWWCEDDCRWWLFFIVRMARHAFCFMLYSSPYPWMSTLRNQWTPLFVSSIWFLQLVMNIHVSCSLTYWICCLSLLGHYPDNFVIISPVFASNLSSEDGCSWCSCWRGQDSNAMESCLQIPALLISHARGWVK